MKKTCICLLPHRGPGFYNWRCTRCSGEVRISFFERLWCRFVGR